MYLDPQCWTTQLFNQFTPSWQHYQQNKMETAPYIFQLATAVLTTGGIVYLVIQHRLKRSDKRENREFTHYDETLSHLRTELERERAERKELYNLLLEEAKSSSQFLNDFRDVFKNISDSTASSNEILVKLNQVISDRYREILTRIDKIQCSYGNHAGTPGKN